MGLLILLAILAIVLFGAGFVVKWLFILAAAAALLFLISLFTGGWRARHLLSTAGPGEPGPTSRARSSRPEHTQLAQLLAEAVVERLRLLRRGGSAG
jgi:cell division protein FtsW (lipid II flippase)